MASLVVHDSNTGSILHTQSGANPDLDHSHILETIARRADKAVSDYAYLIIDEEHPSSELRSNFIVKNGECLLRTSMGVVLNAASVTANGVDLATLTNLPTPCEVALDGTQYQITDGVFEVSFDLPGTYEIEVEAFPYLPAKFTVEAV